MTRPRCALFLAAGRGLRLGPRGREIPKGFLEIGGRTLVERAVERLVAAQIEEIVFVTGHLHDRYDALARRYDGRVRTVFNPDFATRGSAHSLAVGLAAVGEGDVLVSESDLVWETRALSTVLDHAGPSCLLVSGRTDAGDEVWVWAAPGDAPPRLDDMAKRRDLRPDEPHGELVGLTRVGALLRARLVGAIAEAVDPMADYESRLVAAAKSVPLPLMRVDDLIWAEIDDETMYARARTAVWPRIVARDGAA